MLGITLKQPPERDALLSIDGNFLQPNGFISGYMGTTLGFPGQELFFRNLDGSGKLLREVDLRGKTIVNDSRLLSTVIAGSNIIQNFSFELSCDGEPFYRGNAVFGYFKADALKTSWVSTMVKSSKLGTLSAV